MKKEELIIKLNNFKNAYYDLISFEDIETVINDERNLPFYPFTESFDEIAIFDWINQMIKNLK
ncbi:hypothetical protein KAZ01_04195 [Candidatus Gracilibacteria bacterium]|nr:hypothetical protein [Candidatus Gracilibacteria bacterium]